MSPRTLNSIGNWCFYKISLVHLPFSTVFYIFNHISVSFGPINMFLVHFKGYLRGYKRPVHFNIFFQSLHLKNEKTRLQVWSFVVLVWSGYGLFPVTRLDFQTLHEINGDGCLKEEIGTNKWQELGCSLHLHCAAGYQS